MGLTESTGDDGLRFEIWFRRRTSKNQTFLLQATTAEAKHAWTCAIARILWTQATRNKGRGWRTMLALPLHGWAVCNSTCVSMCAEMRLKEMVSMGVGNKPFLDIQPSDAAISNRAVHCIMKSRGAKFLWRRLCRCFLKTPSWLPRLPLFLSQLCRRASR